MLSCGSLSVLDPSRLLIVTFAPFCILELKIIEAVMDDGDKDVFVSSMVLNDVMRPFSVGDSERSYLYP